MTCVEKHPHASHRSTMLHHRFPNGFSEIFMDETDREVSTLTDRAFRSLCVGDEAVYNDEVSHGYSPFSCHKPLVGEPLKKTKDASKKHQVNSAQDTQPWRQQKGMSSMSLLKAFSATEENCQGLLIKNGDFQDNNGVSWDKSALLSIERELSEFSSDYNTLTAKKSGVDEKSTKTKNGKSKFKLRKLNIKNFFLHSEFSPFQSWRDFNRFPFSQENITAILPVVDNLPKWYDSPLYKELTDAHRIEKPHAEETGQQQPVKPPPPPPPPPSPRPPPKVLPKPSISEKRCASDTSSHGETIAPWRRNRARAKSTLPVNQTGVISHPTETSKLVEECPLPNKKEVKSVKVNEAEEPCSFTPFSISQLMTPIIPCRQATDTSDMMSVVLSPSLLDLPLLDLEHVSPVKAGSTPEVVKRESYKSIASSLLFNLKDNRKRVKSRYSPTKFKTEQADRSTLSPKLLEQRLLKYAHAPSEGRASGFSTPAILASGLNTPAIQLDGQPVNSAVAESSNAGVGKYLDSDLSDNYLISNLLQTKREAARSRSPGIHFTHSKVNKSHLTKKQTYPTLNLYKSPTEPEIKHISPSVNKDTLSITTPTNLRSPNTSNETKDHPSTQKKGTSPEVSEKPVKEILELKEKNIVDQPTLTGYHREEVPTEQNKVFSLNTSENTNQPTKEKVELKEKRVSEESARISQDTLIPAQNKILSSKRSDHTKSSTKDITELNVKDTVQEVMRAGMEAISTTRNKIFYSTDNAVKTEAPLMTDKDAIVGEDRHSFYSFSIPKPSYRQTEAQTTGEIYPNENILTNKFIDVAAKEKESIVEEKEELVKKQGRFKHIFSARQNNYIKSQRCAMMENSDKKQDDEDFETDFKVNKKEVGKLGLKEMTDMKDREHIISDLHELKELEKARLSERQIMGSENLKAKPVIDEEAKTKNDLISRELRNIKRGMLSMRGNTSAKKEVFINKEKEQKKHNVFSKIDNNVVINKSLINDNYDKAKMALEEIISDRAEKLKNKVFNNKEEDNNTVIDKSLARQDTIQTSEQKQKEVRDRLGDLRDHYQIQEILSQTETKLSGDHRLDATIYAENKNATKPIKEHQEQGNISTACDQQKHNISKYSTEDSYRMITEASVKTRDDTSRKDEVVTEESQPDAPVVKPEVPPRSKKGNSKKEDSTVNEKGCVNVMAVSEEDTNNKECSSRGRNNDKIEARGKVSNREALDAKIKAERQTDTLVASTRVEQEQCTVNVDEGLVQDITEKLSPLSNGSSVNPGQQDQNSMSSKSSYFSVESSFHRNIETDSNVYHSLENLIAESEEFDEGVEDVPECVREDMPRRMELEYYSISDHENENVEDKPVASPKLDSDISLKEDKESTGREMDQRGWVQSPKGSTNNQPATSQSNVFSPVLGKPSLFKVKDNTFSHHVLPVTKTVKPVLHKTNPDPGQRAPWSPRGSMSGSERSEEDHLDHLKESTEILSPTHVTNTPEKPFKCKETHSPHSLQSPLKLNPEHTQKRQCEPWSPRESLTGSEKGKEDNVEILEPHDAAITPDKPKETASHPAPHSPLSPPKLNQDNSQKSPKYGSFLTVPQGDNIHPGVSPSSEGGTVDTAYDTPEGSKVPSERSGSVCSGNETQGPGRPPVVPPKSEKALLKAMKLTTRRMRKEEEKIKPHKSCSSSKSRSGRSYPNRKLSEQKSSKTDSSDKPCNGEKQQLERMECSSRSGDKCHVESEHQGCSNEKHRHSDSELRAQNGKKHLNGVHKRHSHDNEKSPQERMEHGSRNGEKLKNGESEHQDCNHDKPNCGTSERQSRSSEQQSREKPDKRFLSSDRALSEYKRLNSEKSAIERKPRHRAQSMDRHISDKAEKKINSSEASSTNRPEPRSDRIEKSIRDELSQRGRARERSHREKPDNRNHSVDSYASEVIDLTSPQPNLSRQSSNTSQFSHQSSIEHGYASFPMTQRKLLQDPDSGQYFVFDMPVQVKTKTFFDPETGNYVQLPVQPPEDPMPQASTMEVMNAPRVIYHGSFVPVPVSSISSQNSVVHASQLDQEQFEQRLEKQWYNHNNEGHPYLEPVYGSQDHTIGEFLGTEERYDCMS